MHLSTTLIVSNNNFELKTNNRSHLLNFLHPLHILKKIHSEKLESNTNQQKTESNSSNKSAQENNGFLDEKINFECEKKINNFIPTEKKEDKKHTNFLNGFRKNLKNTEHLFENLKNNRSNQKDLSKNQEKHNLSTSFNEEEGVLEHLFKKFYCSNNQFLSEKCDLRTKKEEILNGEVNKPKCFLLFGFSISLQEIQQFLLSYPEINLTVKMYKYEEHEFFKEIEIIQNDEVDIEEKYEKLSSLMNEGKILDCEEITFVFMLWKVKENVIKETERMEIGEMYFFPNINTESSLEEKSWIKSGVERESLNLCRDSSSISYNGSMGSLRKSHQNFRILQVLEYYMSLECHSEHIMISSNESLIIREFLSSMYEKQLKEFYIFIDHESKSPDPKNSKPIYDPTQRSIIPTEKEGNLNSFMASHTSNFLSTSSAPQFMSLNDQLIINDQFLSKLSSIKPPEKCTDSPEFRKQKQIMYHMKLEEYHEEKELRKVKKEFTETINYLNSLIGLDQVSYEEISLESLKNIKNAKIKQSTTELKELLNLSQEKEFRYQDLKFKIALYEKLKVETHELHDSKLSALRKDIIDLQKELNLHKNQISNIYEMNSNEQSPQLNTLTENNVNERASLTSEKSEANLMQKSKNNFKLNYEIEKGNLSLKHPNMPNKVFSKSELKNNSPNAPRESLIRPQIEPLKRGSYVGGRNSSQQFLNKYALILEQLRKQKYEEKVKQEKTKCEFEAEKEFEKLKEEYKKATKDLLLILGDCD